MRHFDVIWIGTGQATFTVVPRLAAAGKHVAIVEGGKFGGTCVNHGCTPTKTLVASAYAVNLARRGGDFGFSIDGLNVDFAKVMETQQANRASSSAGIEKGLASHGEVIKGYAEFVDDKSIRVDGEVLSADTIVIHTGTRPRIPAVPGIDGVPWLSNETLLDLTELPKHLLIVGGSYIGLEFAQIFRRLGSDVTIFERGPRLVSREDADIAELVHQVLSDDGIRIVCDANIEEVGVPSGGGVEIGFTGNGVAAAATGSHVLFAIGRTPNSDRLRPDAAGLELSARGFIPVNDVMQTNVPHIFAIGDVNGLGAFTHTSVNDGEIFWDHYARKINASSDEVQWDRTARGRTLVYSLFIDPPLARVGMNETEARASGRDVLMATAPMSRIARAREKRETNGLVKLFVDANTEEILGATYLERVAMR